ncbi:hypothetical protein, partial [Streptomyces sp. NPDC089915]|uniref:hypothetical protein n=1 Tax=Streptomyces sp. NPDC089915 TaxID=3155186 RepID=UPI003446EDEC
GQEALVAVRGAQGGQVVREAADGGAVGALVVVWAVLLPGPDQGPDQGPGPGPRAAFREAAFAPADVTARAPAGGPLP